VQAQYEAHQDSEDQLGPGGAVLNRDRLLIRRARVRLEYDHRGRWAQLELDGNTVRDVGMSIRRANVGWVFRGPDPEAPHRLRIRAGLTEIPFGHDLRRGQEELLLLERAEGSFAFFSGPTDTGVRLDGTLGRLEYDVAVQNGSPVDDFTGGQTTDPTRAPDLALRLGSAADIGSSVHCAGGASLLTGTGFSPGTDAFKPRVEWRDLNENESFDTGELIAIPGRGAIPSYTFRRWAVGLDARLSFRTSLGETRLGAEAALASNLDRGLFVADPVQAGVDIRHHAWHVQALQEFWQRAWLGVRYDVYDPDSDALDDRRGFRVPQDVSIRTLSPVAVWKIAGFGRLTVQYDHVMDRLARSANGVPEDLANNRWFVRLQGEF
jgi:hypothetical protein